MQFFTKLIGIGCIFVSLQVWANQACYDMIPQIENSFNNIKAIPAYLSNQIQIDKAAKGLDRFQSIDGNVVLMDAERVPLTKNKTLSPVSSLEGLVFQGIHMATRTYRTFHNGIEIFDMELVSSLSEIKAKSHLNPDIHEDTLKDEVRLSMFKDPFRPFYFKNFELQKTPFVRDNLEGRTWTLTHQEDRSQKWSQHSFLYNSGLTLSADTYLQLFFETDFDNTAGGIFLLNWFHNSFSGSRIDTCVYFLVTAQ